MDNTRYSFIRQLRMRKCGVGGGGVGVGGGGSGEVGVTNRPVRGRCPSPARSSLQGMSANTFTHQQQNDKFRCIVLYCHPTLCTQAAKFPTLYSRTNTSRERLLVLLFRISLV